MSTAIRTPLLGVSLSNKWKNLKSLLCPWHNFNAHLPTCIYFNSAGHAYYKNGNQLQLWLIIIKILNKEIVSAYTQTNREKTPPLQRSAAGHVGRRPSKTDRRRICFFVRLFNWIIYNRKPNSFIHIYGKSMWKISDGSKEMTNLNDHLYRALHLQTGLIISRQGPRNKRKSLFKIYYFLSVHIPAAKNMTSCLCLWRSWLEAAVDGPCKSKGSATKTKLYCCCCQTCICQRR